VILLEIGDLTVVNP